MENLTFYLAYISGFASFFSPCLIPLLPSYFAVITGFTLKDLYGLDFKSLRLRVFLSSLFFVAGFSLVYSLLGATGTLIGKYLNSSIPSLIRLSGIFLILLGLVQLGVIKFKSLEFDFAWNVQKKLAKLGYFNAFITGIALALIWIPCVGQILTAMLILASNSQTATQGLMLLFIFSLGLGTPFLLLGLFFPWIFPKIGEHRQLLHSLNLGGGVLLIIFGIVLVANQYGYYLQLLK
jgi:cytochrome c-type biogenesis protein